MSGPARHALLVAILAWGSAACDQPAPVVEGVGPTGSARAPESPSQKPVELARPDAPLAQQPAAPNPAASTAPNAAGKPPPVDLADLGSIDVMSWDDARRQAEQRITPDTADAELVKLQSELESGP